MAAFAIACQRTGMLQSLEKSALDHAFRLRRPAASPPPITLVLATETDLQILGQWPLSDETLGQALQIIQAAQPSVIGLNLHRDLPVQPGTAELNRFLQASNNLIGVQKVVSDGNDAPLLPPPALINPERIAASDLLPDRDGRLRRHILSLKDAEGNVVLSLGAKVALEYLAKEQGIQQEFLNYDRYIIRLGKATFRALRPSDGGYVEADEGGYQILSNFHHSPEVFETIQLTNLLNGKFSEEQLRDRIVLFGTTARSLQNPFFTPMTQTPDNAWFGVEIQADLAGQIVAAANGERSLLRGVPEPLDWLWVMLWASGGALLGTYLPSSKLSLMLALPVGGALLLGSGYLLFLKGWWIVVVSPGLAFVGAGLLSRRLVLDQQLARSRAQLFNYQLTLDEQIQERTQVLQAQTEQLAQAQERSEASNRAKSEFLARMSHELRTPLNSIIGFSSLMRNDPSLGSIYRENLGIIRQSGEYLLSLINDVLDFAKIEANQVTIDNGTVDIRALVRNLESMFRFQARQKRLKFRCSIDSQVPKAITIDEKKLRQILINLLGNAMKFTPGGHVILRVWAETPQPEQPLIHFEVEDTGVGISQTDLTEIFEPFTQGQSPASQSNEPGTGLGLAISHTLVQRMGGKIWARSRIDQGSRFHVTFPLKRTTETPPPPTPPPIEYQETVQSRTQTIATPLPPSSASPFTAIYTTKVTSPPPTETPVSPVTEQDTVPVTNQEQANDNPNGEAASNKAEVLNLSSIPIYRVLVVDDNTLNRKLLKRLLLQANMKVREVNHGLAAIANWEHWRPDLILMDMRMPVMDGYEATRFIRKQEQEKPGLPPTPIIAISASVTSQEKEAALAAGCDAMVQKPFKREQVLEAIAKALNSQLGGST